MTPQTTPRRLDLKRDERLTVEWEDGRVCRYTLAYLRSMCPCAQCRETRKGETPAAPPASSAASPGGGAKRKPLLTILPGNYAEPLRAVGAEMVGNYAIRIDWSDQHGSGIYSFQYLREICPQ